MKTLENIYSLKNWQKKHDLQVKVKEYSDTIDIDLTDNEGKPDCCIGHFGYNFYIRTPKGMRYEKYKTLCSLFKSIKMVLENKGLSVESIGIKKFYRYRAVVNY